MTVPLDAPPVRAPALDPAVDDATAPIDDVPDPRDAGGPEPSTTHPQSVSAFLLAALAIGAVLTADPSGLAPFGPAKWLTISVLGFGAAGASMWRAGADAADRADRASAAGTGANRWWIMLLVLLGIAALVGGDAPTALLGHPNRHLGLLTWVLFALLFAAGRQLRHPSAQRTVVHGIAIAAVVAGIWSTWELAFGRVIDLRLDTSRLTGPFGSAAMLAAAACLLSPVATGLALDRTEATRWRVTGAIGAITTAAALLGSGTRGAWVGVGVTAVVVAVRVRPRRRTLAVAALALTAAIGLVAPRMSDVTERDAGGGSRLAEWRVAARVIAAHPLVGVGPEGYRIAVRDGVDRDYERTYGRDDTLPDRAHSAPLDVALAGGIGAAIAYVALLALVGGRCLRLLRRGGAAMHVGLAAGVIAYAVQQLVLFPLAEVDPLWWTCAGMVMAITAPAPRPRPSPSPSSATGPRRAGLPADKVAGRVAGAFAVAVAAIALAAGLLDVAADRLARRSLVDLAAGRGDDSAAQAERATRLRPDDVRYRLLAASVHATIGTVTDIDRGLEQADAARSWSSDDPYAADQWASLLLQRAQVTGDHRDIDVALAAWSELVVSDPHRARWQLQLGRAAVLAGDVGLARRAWTEAVDLSPDDHTAARLLAALPNEEPAP